MARETKRYSLHIEPELMEWIEQQMKDNHRTKIGQIKMMLEMSKKQIEDKK